MPSEVIFLYTSRIEKLIKENPLVTHVNTEFETYKRNGLDFGDMPAPDQYIQEENISEHELMGRDRAFYSPIEARREDLFHIHVWQQGDMWDGKVQWACTGDSYIIYSYFEHERIHIFYIIDYFQDNAHDIYSEENNKILGYWALQARIFRESYINNS